MQPSEKPGHPGHVSSGRKKVGLGLATGIILVASVAAMFAGAVFASSGVLSPIGVHETAASYQVSASAAQAFPNVPTLVVGTDGNGTCTPTGTHYPWTSATDMQTQVQESVTGVCAQGNAIEQFDWTSPQALDAQTVTFEITVVYGPANATASLTATLNVAAGTVPSGYTANFALSIDMGSPVLPSIAEMSILVT